MAEEEQTSSLCTDRPIVMTPGARRSDVPTRRLIVGRRHRRLALFDEENSALGHAFDCYVIGLR
jgi:hypothetical protein